MSSTAIRMQALRERRRLQGMKMSTIWLSPEDQKLIDEVIESGAAKSQSDALRVALHKAFSQEPQMNT